MKVLFPENIPHVSSFHELMESDLAIWPCIKPQAYDKGKCLEVGSTTLGIGGLDDSFMEDQGYQANGWAIVHARNIRTHRQAFLTTEDGSLLAGVAHWWRLGSNIGYFGDDEKIIGERAEAVINALPKHELKKVRVPVTFFNQGPHGHWLFEDLLPLAIWQRVNFYPYLLTDIPKVPGYRKELLSLSGYPTEKLLISNYYQQDHFLEDLWLAVPWRNLKNKLTPLTNGWVQGKNICYDRLDSWWHNFGPITLDFAQNIGLKASSAVARGERILVIREGSAVHRLCINEHAILEMVKKYGFVPVEPSKLGGEEEAAIFKNAKIIIGSSGGGIWNTIYCNSHTHVICYGAQDDLFYPLQGICATNNLNLSLIRSTQFNSVDKAYGGALSLYTVDIHLLERFLLSICKY